MRRDVATVLQSMGYVLDRDFVAVAVSGGVGVTWLSDVRQPTEAEIEAAALPAARASIWEQIKAERDRRKLEQGYVAGGKRFHSDIASRSEQTGLILMGDNIPAGVMWKTMDGSFIEMTPELARQVLISAVVAGMAIHKHAEQLRAQVNAAQDPSSVDILTGWPE